VGVHVPDIVVWEDVKNGKLNGFSMEALVMTTEKVIEIEILQEINTETLPDDTGHVHNVIVRFSDEGEFLGGRTDMVNGHIHFIKRFTHTEETDEHLHRYALVEAIGEIINAEES